MRIVFMGTPDFAVPSLRAVLEAGHEVVAVYTQPPRAAGRGLANRNSPVQVVAESAKLPVFTPTSLKGEVEQARFRALQADAAVVVAYGLILPKPVLGGTRYGCFNLHASLLPRWRGAAPIQRAIMAGDTETGVAIMCMDSGLDTGAVSLAEKVPIHPNETAGELHDRLAVIGAALMVRALGDLEEGSLACWPQHEDGLTYAAKIEPGETRIDWSRPAPELHNKIRGLSPHPGAWFELERGGKRERIRALRSEIEQEKGRRGTPGEFLGEGLVIACGDGAIRLTEVQRAGKRPMRADDFLRGITLPTGSVLV
jgi:methionyl-tRNA formyltransferase